MEVLMVDH